MALKKESDYFEARGISSTVEDTEDGGAIVIDESPAPSESAFYDNLAEKLAPRLLQDVGNTLCDLISKDKEARKKRDEQYQEGIRRTGLGDDAPGGAQFMGASKVVHPMLTEACVDFAARTMKEIFPADGPAKSFIAGEPTQDELDRGDRLADYLNYQCTIQMPEFRAELEQMATQLPLGGGQYIKITWDARKKRPVCMFVPIDDVYLPFAATNFYTAERKTHVQYITALEYQMRIKSEMYLDVDLVTIPLIPEFSKSEEATNKIEGRQASSYNEDGLRTIYECACIYDLEDKYGPSPYIISIDKSTQKVLAIYRNWKEDDDKQEELIWMIEFSFIPWRGAYPIGLPHMVGGVSGAATGALRALLDSAHINNFPGLLKLKSSISGQTERIDPTEVREIEGSIQDDDVRKLVMPMPFNPPSPVLFELLGFLVDAGKNVVRTTMEELADSNKETPVGTTLARMEQGMMVFSAIHGRMHDAMGRLLKVLYRINQTYLEEQEVYDETGKLLAKRKDFEGPMLVVPVSDPNIFTEQQRYAQIQVIAQRAQLLPQIYNLRKVEELLLERIKIPNAESLLLPKQEPDEMNAINENVAATMQRPIIAFPDQDHLAHLQVHLDFMKHPMFGQNPAMAPKCLPVLVNHVQEHISLYYVSHVIDIAQQSSSMDINEMQMKSTTEEKQAFDRLLAAASPIVMNDLQNTFAGIPPVLQQAQQFLQQMQQNNMQDPTLMLGMEQIKMQRENNQMRAQLDTQKMQNDMQIEQAKLQASGQMEGAKLQSGQQLELMKLQQKQAGEQGKLSQQQQTEQGKQALSAADMQQKMQIEALKQQAEDARTAAQLQTQMAMKQLDVQNDQEKLQHQSNIGMQQKAMELGHDEKKHLQSLDNQSRVAQMGHESAQKMHIEKLRAGGQETQYKTASEHLLAEQERQGQERESQAQRDHDMQKHQSSLGQQHVAKVMDIGNQQRMKRADLGAQKRAQEAEHLHQTEAKQADFAHQKTMSEAQTKQNKLSRGGEVREARATRKEEQINQRQLERLKQRHQRQIEREKLKSQTLLEKAKLKAQQKLEKNKLEAQERIEKIRAKQKAKKISSSPKPKPTKG